MNKRKITIISIIFLCVAIFAVGTTVAFLVARSNPVENVFTIGDIKLSLTETTGTSYRLLPGKTVDKNPHVLVKGGSEECWLFIRISKSDHFDDYIEYQISDGWELLDGHRDVYFMKVAAQDTDTDVGILKDDCVRVKDTLTEEKMTEITVLPKITFKAYAIQSHSIAAESDAWAQILEEVTE